MTLRLTEGATASPARAGSPCGLLAALAFTRPAAQAATASGHFVSRPRGPFPTGLRPPPLLGGRFADGQSASPARSRPLTGSPPRAFGLRARPKCRPLRDRHPGTPARPVEPLCPSAPRPGKGWLRPHWGPRPPVAFGSWLAASTPAAPPPGPAALDPLRLLLLEPLRPMLCPLAIFLLALRLPFSALLCPRRCKAAGGRPG